MADGATRWRLSCRCVGGRYQVTSAVPKADAMQCLEFCLSWPITQYGEVPCDMSTSEAAHGNRGYHGDAGDEDKAKRAELKAIGESIFGDEEMTPEALWAFMSALSDADLDRVIAFGVAGAVSLRDAHESMTGRLLDSLGFDVADTFTPTADNFFARAPKEFAASALIETGKRNEADRDVLVAMKKGELAKVAAEEVTGTRWVPELIRTPKPTPAVCEEAPTKAGKKTPTKRAKAKA